MYGNHNNSTRIDDLIIKFLDRQTTTEEEDELRSWISQSEDNQRYFTEIQYLWETVAVEDKTSFDSEAAFQRFKARIEVKQTANKNPRRNFYAMLPWTIALISAAIVVGLGFYIFYSQSLRSNKKLYSIHVPYGAKTKVKLPDKSIVWLNSGSTLSYNKNFGKESREVMLKGEGYFEIAQDLDKPFIVHTKHASVKSSGTQFDINDYPGNNHIDVTLLKGSIHLKTIYQTNVLTLKPNQSAIIDKKNHKVVLIKVDASKSVEWTKGKSFFEDKSFGNIINSLEQSCYFKIVVSNSKLNKLPYYDDFGLKQAVNDILNIMETKMKHIIR